MTPQIRQVKPPPSSQTTVQVAPTPSPGRLTSSSTREQFAAEIVKQGEYLNFTPGDIQAAIDTADVETDLQHFDKNGRVVRSTTGKYAGLFQQGPHYGDGRFDPIQNIRGFWNEAARLRASGGWSDDDPFANMVWVQLAPAAKSAKEALRHPNFTAKNPTYLSRLRNAKRNAEARALYDKFARNSTVAQGKQAARDAQ